MTDLHIRISKDEHTFKNETGRTFLEVVHKAVEERGKAFVALSGGETPKKFFDILVSEYFQSRIPWSRLTFFWVDERWVPADDPLSNYRLAKDRLFSRVVVPESNIHRIPTEMESAHEAARAYQNTLRSVFHVSAAVPRFDFMLLGVGADGHTASLFPNSPALHEISHWVMPNHALIQPADRITMTFPVINEARHIAILCTGLNKAKIVRDVFRDDLPPGRFPVQRVNPRDGETVWFLDRASASELPPLVMEKAQHI